MNGKVVPVWVVTLLAGIILVLGGYLYSDLKNGQIREAQAVATRFQELDVTRSLGFQRLATLEGQTNALNARLDRIEDKLDTLIAQTRRSP